MKFVSSKHNILLMKWVYDSFAPVWMAQFRKRGASFSTSQPCRAACIHGIWNILFSCRQRTCKMCDRPRHTLRMWTQSLANDKKALQITASCSWCKQCCKKTSFKVPYWPIWDPVSDMSLSALPTTASYAFSLPACWPRERERQRGVWNVSKFDSNFSSFYRLYIPPWLSRKQDDKL